MKKTQQKEQLSIIPFFRPAHFLTFFFCLKKHRSGYYRR